jgi:hypothetical protein
MGVMAAVTLAKGPPKLRKKKLYWKALDASQVVSILILFSLCSALYAIHFSSCIYFPD